MTFKPPVHAQVYLATPKFPYSKCWVYRELLLFTRDIIFLPSFNTQISSRLHLTDEGTEEAHHGFLLSRQLTHIFSFSSGEIED